MKREQLTNVTTESIDQRIADLHRMNTDTYCNDLAFTALVLARMPLSAVGKQCVIDYADKIISLRSQQVTP